MDIEKLLREFRENTASLAIIEDNIKTLCDKLKIIEKPDIEALTFLRNLENIPDKNKNLTSRTETIALFLEEKEQLEIDSAKAAIANEIIKLYEGAEALRRKIEPIKRAIEGLYEQERFIIRLFYIEGLSMPIVRERYKKVYHEISCNRLWHFKTQILSKLKKIIIYPQTEK
jgi:DNA-directed RNA polymerase specialized sigma subunit